MSKIKFMAFSFFPEDGGKDIAEQFRKDLKNSNIEAEVFGLRLMADKSPHSEDAFYIVIPVKDMEMVDKIFNAVWYMGHPVTNEKEERIFMEELKKRGWKEGV